MYLAITENFFAIKLPNYLVQQRNEDIRYHIIEHIRVVESISAINFNIDKRDFIEAVIELQKLDLTVEEVESHFENVKLVVPALEPLFPFLLMTDNPLYTSENKTDYISILNNIANMFAGNLKEIARKIIDRNYGMIHTFEIANAMNEYELQIKSFFGTYLYRVEDKEEEENTDNDNGVDYSMFNDENGNNSGADYSMFNEDSNEENNIESEEDNITNENPCDQVERKKDLSLEEVMKAIENAEVY